jgi:hypothetical protein
VRELESPTLRNGELSVTQTVTTGGPDPEWGPRDVWVFRADGALEHYPDAFR